MKSTLLLFTGAAAYTILQMAPLRANALESPPDPDAKENLIVNPPNREIVPAQLSLHQETFSLPLQEAGPLMREELNDEQRYQRFLALLSAGKARQENLIVARTKSGQRMVVEGIDEWRYATEYGLPNFGTIEKRAQPGNVNQPGQKAPAPGGDRADVLRPTDPEVLYHEQIAATGPIPTEFEVRNIGQTLEMEPVIGPDNKTIDLNLVTQTVRYAGEHEINEPRSVKQPTFETQKITTSMSITAGKPVLLGTCNPPFGNGISKDDPEHRIWFVFLTCHLITSSGETTPIQNNSGWGRAEFMNVTKLEYRDVPAKEIFEQVGNKIMKFADPVDAGLHLAVNWNAAPTAATAKISLTLDAPMKLSQAIAKVAELAGVTVSWEADPLVMVALPKSKKP